MPEPRDSHQKVAQEISVRGVELLSLGLLSNARLQKPGWRREATADPAQSPEALPVLARRQPHSSKQLSELWYICAD